MVNLRSSMSRTVKFTVTFAFLRPTDSSSRLPRSCAPGGITVLSLMETRVVTNAVIVSPTAADFASPFLMTASITVRSGTNTDFELAGANEAAFSAVRTRYQLNKEIINTITPTAIVKRDTLPANLTAGFMKSTLSNYFV